MKLSEEALNDLRNVLTEQGFSNEANKASREELEQFGMFLLNLTAAAVKTREKMRLIGCDIPPSSFESDEKPPTQASLPGFD